ncbi:hypothetical protein DF213_14435 [Dickeya dianthicola]|uniref:Uncharacterized protein n=1 Tax=Dickeya dianthicola TaxID=204039 RepID=A0AAX1C3U6_9GAMM|nr:hypothetical protein DF213_14435 [Dickeya dianthicola]
MPCQWRRIIGSSSGLTSDKCKKIINRMVFRQNEQEYSNVRLFNGIKRQNSGKQSAINFFCRPNPE